MHRDTGDARDIAEGDGEGHEGEGLSAAGPAQGSVLVVRGGVVPFAEPGLDVAFNGGLAEAVRVAGDHQVGGERVVVMIIEAWRGRGVSLLRAWEGAL